MQKPIKKKLLGGERSLNCYTDVMCEKIAGNSSSDEVLGLDL